MGQFYSGQNGKLLIDGVAAAKVTNWTFTGQMSALSTTSLEDTDQTFIGGLRTMTGQCRLYYYDSGGVTNANSAKTLIDKLIKTRTTADDPGKAAEPEYVTLRLQVVEGTATKEVEMEVLLTNAAMSMAVGEVLAADVAFQVNGAPKALTL